MARRKRSPSQLALVEGVESWYMPAALVRSKLSKVAQYCQFIEHPDDRPAVRLILIETNESLQLLDQCLARWQAFWSMVYEATEVSTDDAVRLLSHMKREVSTWRKAS